MRFQSETLHDMLLTFSYFSRSFCTISDESSLHTLGNISTGNYILQLSRISPSLRRMGVNNKTKQMMEGRIAESENKQTHFPMVGNSFFMPPNHFLAPILFAGYYFCTTAELG